MTGFVDGYQRQWTSSPDGYTIDQIFLYEFQTPEGRARATRSTGGTPCVQTNSGSPLQTFTPAFIPGAFGLQAQGKTGSTAVVMFAKGIYAVEATVNGGVLAAGDPRRRPVRPGHCARLRAVPTLCPDSGHFPEFSAAGLAALVQIARDNGGSG